MGSAFFFPNIIYSGANFREKVPFLTPLPFSSLLLCCNHSFFGLGIILYLFPIHPICQVQFQDYLCYTSWPRFQMASKAYKVRTQPYRFGKSLGLR